MNIRTTQFKTVSATTAQDLDNAIRSAKAEITRANENAQFVDLRLAASQGTLYATIIWSG